MPLDQDTIDWLSAREPPHTFPYCDECGGPEHQSVHLTRHITYGRMSACVDEDMCGLVMACWRNGIITTEACQGHDRDDFDEALVFLSFDNILSYARFADAVTRGGQRDTVFERIVGTPPYNGTRWLWECHPADISAEWDVAGSPIEPDLFCAVVFPLADVDAATERLTSLR